jgi:hypothetical protein
VECRAEEQKRAEVYRRQRVATSPSAQAEIERSHAIEKALKQRIEELKALAERMKCLRFGVGTTAISVV